MIFVSNKRVFLAVNIPKEIKEKIAELFLSKLKVDGLKPVAEENLHFTVKFLGHLPEESLGELEGKLNELNFKKFEVEVSGVGDFHGRVIWLGVSKGGEELKELSLKVNELLGLEEEKFSAHLTIARNKFLEKEKVKGILGELKGVEFRESFSVESLDLMESELSKTGPKYSILKRIEFQD